MSDQISTTRKLSGKQIRFLRALGHKLKPVVMVGRNNITPEVISSVEEALNAHELIKIKLQEGCLENRYEVANHLAEQTYSSVVQVLGKTILLFRPSDQGIIQTP